MRWKHRTDPLYLQRPPLSQGTSGPLQWAALVFIYSMVSPHSLMNLWWLHWPDPFSCLILPSTFSQINEHLERQIRFPFNDSIFLRFFPLLNGCLTAHCFFLLLHVTVCSPASEYGGQKAAAVNSAQDNTSNGIRNEVQLIWTMSKAFPHSSYCRSTH